METNSKKEEKNVELKTTNEINETKVKVDQDAIDLLNKEIDLLKTSISNKVYIVTKEQEDGKYLFDFLQNKVSWKFTEVLGVIELTKLIQDFYDGKSKNLALDGTALQALYYFVGKFEGTGVQIGMGYYNHMLKPVADAVNRMEQDKKELETLEFRMLSLEQGVNPDDFKEKTDE